MICINTQTRQHSQKKVEEGSRSLKLSCHELELMVSVGYIKLFVFLVSMKINLARANKKLPISIMLAITLVIKSLGISFDLGQVVKFLNEFFGLFVEKQIFIFVNFCLNLVDVKE